MGIREVYIDEMNIDGDHLRATFPATQEALEDIEKVARRIRTILDYATVETSDHAECTEAVAGEERWDRDAT